MSIKGIKGMSKDMKCRGQKFEVGKTYEQSGDIKCCENGFHSCPDTQHPLAVFKYYPPGSSRYFNIEAHGNTDSDDDKIASSRITIKSEIELHDLIQRSVKRATIDDAEETSSTLPRGVASNSGSCGAASNSGYRGIASNSGHQGAASNSGERGAASNSGYQGAASNSGYRGAASNSGYQGAASNSGYRGAASNSGERGAASNSGERGAAMSHALGGKVMAEGLCQALFCSEIDGTGVILSVACGITGEKGINPGIWYTAKNGRLIKVEN